MLFTPPSLDDRNFQSIVDELKKRIPLYCPEWTDHNVSDPGVTLIELFAYMAEQLLYRMNQLPLLHYMKFAQFLGVPIPTPKPARAAVTFWLSKPRTAAADPDDQGEIIPEGTEVSTTQTETIAPIIFTTKKSVKISAPRLSTVVKHRRGNEPQHIFQKRFKDNEWNTKLFSDQPLIDDAFYFEFDNDISQHIIVLHLDFNTAVATNINVNRPPIVWEAYTNNHQWEALREIDFTNMTKGFNAPGKVVLHLPRLAKYSWRGVVTTTEKAEPARYSVRVRVTRKEYDASPHLLKIREVATLGRVVEAVHTQVVEQEFLGESNGSPGQRFRLAREPIVLPLEPEEQLWVGPLLPRTAGVQPGRQLENHKQSWQYVENFACPPEETIRPEKADDDPESTAAPAHFSIDVTTNEVRLGPAIRMPDGEIKLYGKIPERGLPLYFTRYRYGGSTANVPSRTINVLKSSIPYIARVENRRPATGGQDMPSLDAMELEVQRYLRFRKSTLDAKAITAEDYRSLVLNRFPEKVAKVECHTQSEHPNTIFVMVVAPIPTDTLNAVSLTETDLKVSDLELEEIARYLHDYRFLTENRTVHIRVENPEFVRVNVRISLTGIEDNETQAQIRNALTIYLHPLVGGDRGLGWALSSLIAAENLGSWVKKHVAGIEIRRIQLQTESLQPLEVVNQPNNSTNQQTPSSWSAAIELAWHQLLIPGRYTLEFA